MELDDINKAKQNIEAFFKLRDEINAATPYLNDMLERLNWVEKVCQTIPEKQTDIFTSISPAILDTNSLNTSNFSVEFVTGLTGSYYNSSGDTLTVIKSYGKTHQSLIDEYYLIPKTDDSMGRIASYLTKINPILETVSVHSAFEEVRKSYSEWKSGARTNSDLAKDARSFLDLFRGVLHQARLNSYNPPPAKNPGENWIKMAEALAKKGGGCEKSLRALQHRDDHFFECFTTELKKTTTLSKEEMQMEFTDFIGFVESTINLIDETKLT